MNIPDRPFQGYAKFYDTMYKQKDYQAECACIEEATAMFGKKGKPKSILDLGCGTGGHALLLADKGYKVHGVDFSEEMLKQAKTKSLASHRRENLSWTECDISKLSLNQQFDQVICMFAVISYMTTNEKLKSFFKVVRNHLVPGGLFICDFWYGPAVLRDPPGKNEKELVTKQGVTKKSASSEIDYNTHVVKVSYELSPIDSASDVEPIKESHYMRYLFLPELEMHAALANLSLEHACDFCQLGKAPGEKSWTISAIFRG